jgi:hypothetical protein
VAPWQPAAEPSYKLSVQTASAAAKISVKPKAGEGYTLEKRDNVWYLTAPMQARADPTQVQQILNLLGATSKEQLPATDLKRFDLDAPALSVTVDAQTFAFGTINPLTQEQYIATGSNVYLVQSSYASQVPREGGPHACAQLVQTGRDAGRLHLQNIQRHAAGWQMDAVSCSGGGKGTPEPGRSQSLGRRLALCVEPRNADGRAGRPAAGETINVKLADGKTLTLNLVRKEPDLVLVPPRREAGVSLLGRNEQATAATAVGSRTPAVPELPEVETTRRGLEPHLQVSASRDDRARWTAALARCRAICRRGLRASASNVSAAAVNTC